MKTSFRFLKDPYAVTVAGAKVIGTVMFGWAMHDGIFWMLFIGGWIIGVACVVDAVFEEDERTYGPWNAPCSASDNLLATLVAIVFLLGLLALIFSDLVEKVVCSLVTAIWNHPADYVD